MDSPLARCLRVRRVLYPGPAVLDHLLHLHHDGWTMSVFWMNVLDSVLVIGGAVLAIVVIDHLRSERSND